ncbi:glycosyltransferase [Pontibacter arcticus]|uniref:Glycosyltransferase n=1 Tax=Pontibacter arcticus TaxID=2080288 RepID=A0A364RDR6_9BACT|nr:glycosyltransferase [Pontibacter arcticus]RAU82419.1 glycosyltransferase [Pontibacter arcticus]
MKKICFFPGTLALGGIGKLFVNLIEEYAARNIAVDVFLTKKEGEFLDQIPANVRIIEGKGRALTSIPKFIKYLNAERPDAVISAREFLNIVNIACCACSSAPTLPVVSLHTNQTAQNFYTNTDKSLYSNSYFIRMARMLYKKPKKIIAVSGGVADDFAMRMGVPRQKIEVIYNPVYKEYVEEAAPVNQTFQTFTKDGRRFIVGVGRFALQKDFSTLLKAFHLVRKTDDITLILLGEGPLRQELEAEIKSLGLTENVLLLGFVDNPLYYIKRAAAIAVSSKFEGFGNIIVEALGVGTPVVSTDCPSGPSEILENGKYGKLVPVGDPQAMATAIVETLHETHNPAALIARARDFAVPKIADEYLAYIYSN